MSIRDTLRRIQQAFAQPFVADNQVSILVDGGAFFDAALEAIASATRTVFVETYILSADKTGWRFATTLAERARAGVEVAIAYDGYGSLTLDRSLVDFLRAAGVKTLEFRPISLFRGVWPWRKRNHRKSITVDASIGIVGGQNIAADYDAVERGGRGWHDVAVRVEGPAVAQLEAMFRRMWARYGRTPLETPSKAPPSFPGGNQVRFLGNFGRRDRAFIRRAYLLAILGAERRIRICNAYFVPDRVMTRALIRAARRGVRVEILIGAATDVLGVLHVSRGFYSKLLRNGILVYEWHDRVLHAKAAVIDGEWVTIGSSNLDDLSSFRNFEVNASILGTHIGCIMDELFEGDVAKSRPILPEAWARRPVFQRILEWFFGRFRGLFSGD